MLPTMLLITCDLFLKEEMMWKEALRIFGIGFPGVFLTLALLCLSVYALSALVRLWEKR